MIVDKIKREDGINQLSEITGRPTEEIEKILIDNGIIESEDPIEDSFLAYQNGLIDKDQFIAALVENSGRTFEEAEAIVNDLDI